MEEEHREQQGRASSSSELQYTPYIDAQEDPYQEDLLLVDIWVPDAGVTGSSKAEQPGAKEEEEKVTVKEEEYEPEPQEEAQEEAKPDKTDQDAEQQEADGSRIACPWPAAKQAVHPFAKTSLWPAGTPWRSNPAGSKASGTLKIKQENQ
jgi:hypothetical protein